MANMINGIIKITLETIKKDPTLFRAINNPNRLKILEILEKAKKPLNILDISKHLAISYKSTYLNVQILANAKLVKLDKDSKASGQAVTVKLLRK